MELHLSTLKSILERGLGYDILVKKPPNPVGVLKIKAKKFWESLLKSCDKKGIFASGKDKAKKWIKIRTLSSF